MTNDWLKLTRKIIVKMDSLNQFFFLKLPLHCLNGNNPDMIKIKQDSFREKLFLV